MRINIEDKLLVDPRFHMLKALMGNDEEKAIGRMWRVFRTAQQFWQDGRKLIPNKLWNGLGLEHVLEVGLAEQSEEGVYVRGVAEHMDWCAELHSKRVKAGKASAQARLVRNGTNIPSNATNSEHMFGGCSTRGETFAPNKPNTPTPALVPAPTPAPAKEEIQNKNLNTCSAASPPAPKKPKGPSGIPVWESYSAAYAGRYGHPPARNARENSLCSQVVERVGADDGAKIAAFYLTHNDRWYVQKLHPLSILLTDIQKLRTEWLAGVQMTDTIAKGIQVQSHNSKVIEEYKRKREGAL